MMLQQHRKRNKLFALLCRGREAEKNVAAERGSWDTSFFIVVSSLSCFQICSSPSPTNLHSLGNGRKSAVAIKLAAHIYVVIIDSFYALLDFHFELNLPM